METNEKELQRLQEQFASMRAEKEILEEVIFNTEKNLETTHGTKTQLEKEQKEMLIKQESLKEQVARLTTELENSEKRAQDIKQSLTQQTDNQIAEFEQILSNMKKQSDDSVKKMVDEKVHIYLFIHVINCDALYGIACIFIHMFLFLSSLQGASKTKLRETTATVLITTGAGEKRGNQSVTTPNRRIAATHRELVPAA